MSDLEIVIKCGCMRIEQEVGTPDQECPWCRSNVRLLAGEVDVGRASNRVDVGTQEEEID